MTKNAIYLTLKALFVLKIFQFLSRLFGHVQNDFIRKRRSISKFMTSKPGKQTITINILPNMPRRKRNQTVTFAKLIEPNMTKVFHEKSFTKCGGETILKPFLKNRNCLYR